jgi:hypothetical protein
MKTIETPFSWTMVMGVLLVIVLTAGVVILDLAGKSDVTLTNLLTYAIPLVIGFLIGVPVNPGTTTSPKA